MSLRTRCWMSTVAACSLIAALSSPALAQDEMKPVTPAKTEPAKTEPADKKPMDDKPAADKPAEAQPATPATPATPAPAAGEPAAPAEPVGIPVPEGEVVHSQTLDNGLLIEDLKIGDGYEVGPNGAVVALYHGTRKNDGFVFDSAFQRGEPVAFPLWGVIPGWQQGVPGMKVGGVRRLTIPAALAYGEQGNRPNIPPNTDLVFVIQLVDALHMEDVKEGTGEEVHGQCVPVTAYTITDADGKEIEKVTADAPYVWLPGEFRAIDFGLEGMKVGGTRHLHVPKEMNVSAPQFAGTRPQNVPLDIDLTLIAVRNLAPKR